MQALSEKCWNKNAGDYHDFESRLKEHFLYLNEHDVEYCPLNICNQSFITRMKIFLKKRRNDDGYAEVRAAKK